MIQFLKENSTIVSPCDSLIISLPVLISVIDSLSNVLKTSINPPQTDIDVLLEFVRMIKFHCDDKVIDDVHSRLCTYGCFECPLLLNLKKCGYE